MTPEHITELKRLAEKCTFPSEITNGFDSQELISLRIGFKAVLTPETILSLINVIEDAVKVISATGAINCWRSENNKSCGYNRCVSCASRDFLTKFEESTQGLEGEK